MASRKHRVKASSPEFDEKDYDIAVDVVCPLNRNQWFSPAQKALRSEARFSELRERRPNGALLQIPGQSIPGARILIDSRAAHGKIIDRMHLPENKEIDKAVRRMTETEDFVAFKFTNYEDDFDADLQHPEDFSRWMYHIVNGIQAGVFKKVRGTIPTMEQLRASGDIVLNNPLAAYGITPKRDQAPFHVLPQEVAGAAP